MDANSHSCKTRSDAVLDGLAPERQKHLIAWLAEENRGYDEVRGLVAAEFGIETSRSALRRYFRKRSDERRATEENEDCQWPNAECPDWRAGEDEDSLSAWRELPPDAARAIEGATLARARQLAFSEITMREPDWKRVTRLLAIATRLERGWIERERVELEARRVALKERAVANAEMAKRGR